jgi:hypothetical protein
MAGVGWRSAIAAGSADGPLVALPWAPAKPAGGQSLISPPQLPPALRRQRPVGPPTVPSSHAQLGSPKRGRIQPPHTPPATPVARRACAAEPRRLPCVATACAVPYCLRRYCLRRYCLRRYCLRCYCLRCYCLRCYRRCSRSPPSRSSTRLRTRRTSSSPKAEAASSMRKLLSSRHAFHRARFFIEGRLPRARPDGATRKP